MQFRHQLSWDPKNMFLCLSSPRAGLSTLKIPTKQLWNWILHKTQWQLSISSEIWPLESSSFLSYCSIWMGYERYSSMPDCPVRAHSSCDTLLSGGFISLEVSVRFSHPFSQKRSGNFRQDCDLEMWPTLHFWQRWFKDLPSKEHSDGGERDKSSWWHRNSKVC